MQNNLARTTHPETSHQAAQEIVKKLGIRQRQTLEAVRQYPGRTGAELADKFETKDSRRHGRRLPELERLGKIVRGKPRRCSVTGRMASTWYVVSESGGKIKGEIRNASQIKIGMHLILEGKEATIVGLSSQFRDIKVGIRYGKNVYDKVDAVRLIGCEIIDHEYRVLRGGSFLFNRKYVRCSYRLRNPPVARLSSLGFRVVYQGPEDILTHFLKEINIHDKQL